MIKLVTTEDLQDQSMLYGFDTKSVLINHVKEFFLTEIFTLKQLTWLSFSI